ncbi:MAG TPA: hypothetical protein VH351_20475 [Bryobacteraceae bacterium]|jgi:hypothetical protein|nr:hypothetical protein [Bryobacteraceae bacterium]
MLPKLGMVALCWVSLLNAVIIDRIAIVTGNSIIKDSDIDRDVRVTEFLNAQPLSFSEAARRAAANRLIDQYFIKTEIRAGGYPTAPAADADRQLTELERRRFHSRTVFDNALEKYGLTEPVLQTQFRWQLTVLTFIDQRFRSAAVVTEDEIQSYFKQHEAELHQRFPGKKSVEDLRGDITDLIEGEKTNQLFFQWLDEQRKQAKIIYHEPDLK